MDVLFRISDPELKLIMKQAIKCFSDQFTGKKSSDLITLIASVKINKLVPN